MNKTNGFATKEDVTKAVNNLEIKMDKRFEQVDKRFEQVDKRFEQVDKRFEEVKGEFSGLRWKMEEDQKWLEEKLFHKFSDDWYTKIDPIIAEIESHREKEVLWAEQAKRREEKWLQQGERWEMRANRLEAQGNSLEKIVKLIAKKIGV